MRTTRISFASTPSLRGVWGILSVLFATTLMACSDEHDVKGYNWSNAPFAVSETTLAFTNKGGEQELFVQSTSQPTLSCDASWLTVEPRSSESKKVYVYKLTAQANADHNDRRATINVQGKDGSQTVNVLQIAADGLVLSQRAFNLSSASQTLTVGVSVNGDVTVSPDVSWIRATAESRADMTTFDIRFAIDENVGAARTGKIFFSIGLLKDSVVVSQEAGNIPNVGMTHTAKELAKLMAPGWNLGNTMEGGNSANNFTNNGGLSAETAWQGTVTTRAFISFLRQQGIRSVRIPTAWVMGHLTDAESMTIDPAWMSRVKEIVDWCVAEGLYVIVNDHWDGGWLENSFGDVSETAVAANSDKLRKLWTNIATAMKDYDEHLLFAGLNEPGMNGNSFNSTTINALYAYEQVFIDAVRATGGNNAVRTLIVQGPQTDIVQTDNLYDIAHLSDSAQDRLMVEVHYYTPWNFCGMEADADWSPMMYYWGEGNNPGNSDRYYANGESELTSTLGRMKKKFVDHGYPVIVGECGANYRFANDASHDASIRAWYKAVTQHSVSNGLVPFYWDTNNMGYPNMTIFNRAQLTVNNSFMFDGMKEGLEAAQWPY